MAKKTMKARIKLAEAPAAAAAKKGAKLSAKPAVKLVLAHPAPSAPASSAIVLDRLWSVILQRRTADPAVSHSARLLSRGTAKVAQKFGEEAVECLIEAVGGNATALVNESADVLYHLLVLWVAGGIEPAMVWAELERREGVSGVTEKAARSLPLPEGGRTRKIP